MAEAAAMRDAGHGRLITFSPKVFIPLTRLCRDSCGYCTFAQPPRLGQRAYMSLEEVLAVARAGAAQGCTEALFTLGDKPELLYPEAAAELAALGFASTLDYVAAAAAAVLHETGLLPHINAGVMGEPELQRLKDVSASQGLMLEGVAPGLAAPGGPHHACPDKEPAARLATIEAAGRARVPFTSGLLIGIGETRQERLDALRALRDAHARHGHIQEVIIQNFRAKPNTAMAHAPEPSLEELLWTVAAARLLLGPRMNIQAPPNLTPRACGGDGSLEAGWRALLDAGINDFGGISPVTRDWINPEAAWPHLAPLATAVADAGKQLVPRLPVYPAFALDLSHGGSSSSSSSRQAAAARSAAPPAPWLSQQGGARSVAAAVHRASDSSGLVRAHEWMAGRPQPQLQPQPQPQPQPQVPPPQAREAEQQWLPEQAAQQLAQLQAQQQPPPQLQQQPALSAAVPRQRPSKLWRISMSDTGVLTGLPEPHHVSPAVHCLLDEVLATAGAAEPAAAGAAGNSSCGPGSSGSAGRQWSEAEVALLLSARGADMAAVVAAADALRDAVCGRGVSYVVNRNINFTNKCTFGCRFCAFSKGKAAEELRGPAYLLSLDDIAQRTAEAWERGATEVCLQGGIHPSFTGETYLAIIRAAKAAAPDIHVHAFSPLEVTHGAASLGLPVPEYLAALKAAGLGSLPGTAAEVLDAHVRSLLCPDKLSADAWLDVVAAAHSVGLPTTSTIMFGSICSTTAWARHLLALRDLQARTGGITEFVPLPFVHFEAPIFLAGAARRGPTLRECVLMHAVARLVLHPLITNIQASWVKMGPDAAGRLLSAGCNDMGGVIMNESITRAAGAAHGQELPPERMEAIIRAAGREPWQRTTLFRAAPVGRVAASFAAAAGAAPLAAAR